jgi:hypothetical protein
MSSCGMDSRTRFIVASGRPASASQTATPPEENPADAGTNPKDRT